MRQKIIFFLLLGSLIGIFVLSLPAAAKHSYDFGRGLIIERSVTQSGLSPDNLRPEEKQLILAAANRSGAIYSALYVAGTIAPIYGLIAILLLQVFSIRTTRFQLGAGAILAAFGIVLSISAAIQLGPTQGRSVLDGIVSAIMVWIIRAGPTNLNSPISGIPA